MRSTTALLALALLAGCLAGCGSGESPDAIKTAPLSPETIAQRIMNDPHMPPDQKAAALARFQSRPMPGAHKDGK